MASEAKIVIKGDSSDAVGAVKRLNTEFGALQSLAAKAFAFGGIAGAITIAAEKIVSVTKAAVDSGDALNKMSQKTGVAVDQLSKLQYAADLSNVSSEALQKGLSSLAVNMVSAATGSGDMSDRFQKMGITLRNSDGTMKSTGAVLAELADRFAAMPDGVEKTDLAVAIFGKKLGAEMIPLLNGGAAGLKAMGDEAEALGLVMSSDLAKQSEEFNDNLERLSKLSNAAGIGIANALIPSLNRVMTAFLEAKKAGGGFWESINAIDSAGNIEKRLAGINGQIAYYNKLKAAGNKPLLGSYDDEISALEKQQKILQAVQEKNTGDGVLSAKELAAKRLGIERQLQTKLAEVAQLRAIAEGKVSAEILLDDDKRTAAQLKNAEKLRDQFRALWKSTAADAAAAGEEARKLFEKAADTRQSGSDKAADKRRSTLTPEEQQKQITDEYSTLSTSAQEAAGLAQIAAIHGRVENAAKLTAQATKDAERAAKLADQIADPEASAAAIEQVAEIQARLLEAQGRAKQADQQALQKAADDSAQRVAELDQQVTDLQHKAAAIKVQADIAEATGAIATLQSQLAALQDKTVTVTVVQNGSVPANADTTIAAQPGGGYARGGWTGPGGKWQPAGIVHADEFVIRQEVVRQRGVKGLLARLNAGGISALNIPGYADGGLVGNISSPALSTAQSAAGSNAVFNFPDFGRFPVSIAPNVMADLESAFALAALKRGGRR